MGPPLSCYHACVKRPYLRLKAALYRTRWILGAIALWTLAAVLAFRWGSGLSWADAWLSALYFEVQPGVFCQGYAFWGQSVVFGVLVALLLRETLENYAERCRLMAQVMEDHTIIVGYTHLGRRLVEHCIAKGLPYVLIERNRALVDDLLRAGEPIIVDDARTPDALPQANLARARRVVIASDNIETALIVTKRAKEGNPACQVIARCAVDDLAGILEKLGADQVFSASRAAFAEIAPHLGQRAGATNVPYG